MRKLNEIISFVTKYSELLREMTDYSANTTVTIYREYIRISFQKNGLGSSPIRDK